MKLINRQEIIDNEDFYINEIRTGKIFIYPTDTLFGLGVNAVLSRSVDKIYEIKGRQTKPFLIIAPSFKWLADNCDIDPGAYAQLKQKLPGAYSFILKLKNKKAVCRQMSYQGTIGVRLPKCWFAKLIEKSGVPFITTSVNRSGQAPALKFDDIPEEILVQADYVITGGEELSGRPSTIIDLAHGPEKILRQ